MFRRLIAVLVIAGVVIPAAAFAPDEQPTEAQGCVFQLGFATLRDMIVAAQGDIVGQCIENEWHNAFNGDGLQRTTGGLFAWRKADNWTAFTNGATTWLNGPCGLQARPNPEIGGFVFAWEGRPGVACTGDAMVAWTPPPPDTSQPPAPAPPGPAAPTSTPGPSASSAPTVELRVSEDRPRQGETFTVRVEANDPEGIESLWWWSTDTSDDNLRDTRTRNCRGATPCRESWDVSTEDEGDVLLHAQARDTQGNLSEEITREIRVRERQATAEPTPTATPTRTLTPS